MPAKHLLTCGLVALLSPLFILNDAQHVTAAEAYVSNQLTFTQNDGQWADQIQYRGDVAGATIWLAADGAYYQFFRNDSDPQSEVQLYETAPSVSCLVIKANFEGASAEAEILGEGQLAYRCNYFLGNDPQKWQTDVPGFESVVYHEIYPGIDLKYYGNGEHLEYDFIVRPGADPSAIRIRYEGDCSLSVNDEGELVVQTSFGTVTEAAPFVYQLDGNDQVTVDGFYVLLADDTFGFEFSESYDPTRTLFIDPLMTYSTFVGGSGNDYLWGIHTDNQGYAYVAGLTNSADFPVVDPIQGEFAGDFDLFICKLSQLGDSLIYATYLGGSGREENPRIRIGTLGEIYLAGRTLSPDFPVFNAYSASLKGVSDAYVVKLTPEGNALIFSTYLGGTADDFATGLRLDTLGNVYLCGYTESSNFPTVLPFSRELLGVSDAFVTKMAADGSELVFSTYLGGSQDDIARGVAVDDEGSVYVCGETISRDFPLKNSLYRSLTGIGDGFVTKLDATGRTLVYSSYLGGKGDEGCTGIDVDDNHHACVAGYTMSDDFPVVNAYQDYFAGGGGVGTDIFLTKFDVQGPPLIFSTYLGGSDDDYCYGMDLSADGEVFIVGATESTDFPMQDPIFETLIAGTDAIISRFSASGDALIFSTYMGGDQAEAGRTIVVDDEDNLWVSGYTASEDFPTLNPYQSELGGVRAGFVTLIEDKCCVGSSGNVDGSEDDILTTSDIVYAVEWMFNSGNYPPCLDEADLDGNGRVGCEDLMYMVAYLFNGGPAPVPCPPNQYGFK